MTILERSCLLLTFFGFVGGISIGSHYSLWVAIIGAPLGAIVGFLVYLILALALVFFTAGPKEFFSKLLPRRNRINK
jgi:hypothetical protein